MNFSALIANLNKPKAEPSPIFAQLAGGMKQKMLLNNIGGKNPSYGSPANSAAKSNPLARLNSGMGNPLAGLLMGKMKDVINKKMTFK